MTDKCMDGTERVNHDEARQFEGETFEIDGLIAEIEHVGTADDDPVDGDARYFFDVHIHHTGTDANQTSDSDRDSSKSDGGE